MKFKRNELTAMVDMLGLPGLFNTFSFADTHWDDLLIILTYVTGKDLTNSRDRQQAIKENPHICDAFFVEKFKIYLDTVLKEELQITDYWCSFEWQKRGAIHVHCLFWTRGQPDILKIIKKINNSEEGSELRVEAELELLAALESYSELINCENPLIGDTTNAENVFIPGTDTTSPQFLTNKNKHTSRN